LVAVNSASVDDRVVSGGVESKLSWPV
jgi:hypothetical protein